MKTEKKMLKVNNLRRLPSVVFDKGAQQGIKQIYATILNKLF